MCFLNIGHPWLVQTTLYEHQVMDCWDSGLHFHVILKLAVRSARMIFFGRTNSHSGVEHHFPAFGWTARRPKWMQALNW